MMASCHFLAFDKSRPFLVKLGRIRRLILAKNLNIRFLFLVNLIKKNRLTTAFSISNKKRNRNKYCNYKSKKSNKQKLYARNQNVFLSE